MKVIKLFTLLLLLGTNADAQLSKRVSAYYENFDKAIECKHLGKIDSAIIYTHSAMSDCPGNNKPYCFLAELWLIKRQYDSAANTLRLAISLGNIPTKIEYYLPGYDTLKEIPQIKYLIAEAPQLINSFYADSYNLGLSRLVYKMMGRDQSIRAINQLYTMKDTTTANLIFSYQSVIDTQLNLSDMLDYLASNGMPKYSEMDDDLANNFGVIIHHLLQYNSPKANKLDSIIKSAVYAGSYSAYSYIVSLDYRYMHQTGHQLYGTYISQDAKGIYSFNPVIDSVATVDSRRRLWGQTSLKNRVYSDWRSPKLPENYKP